MKKYKVVGKSVLDTDTGAVIPENNKSEHWLEYLSWRDAGNTPDPEFTDGELLSTAIIAKKQEIILAYTTEAEAPVTVGSFTFKGGEAAALEIDQILRGAGLLVLPDCDIPDVDGIDRTLILSDARGVLKEMLKILRPLTKKRRKLLHDIKIATSQAEISQIVW